MKKNSAFRSVITNCEKSDALNNLPELKRGDYACFQGEEFNLSKSKGCFYLTSSDQRPGFVLDFWNHFERQVEPEEIEHAYRIWTVLVLRGKGDHAYHVMGKSEKGPEWVDVISVKYGEIEEALGFKPFERTDYIATFSLHDERFRVEYRKQPTWGLPFKRDTIYEIDLMTPPQAAIPPYPYHHTLDSHKQNAPL